MKTFGDYLQALGELLVSYSANACAVKICAVANDSRRVTENTLFCAVKGVNSDGHDYLERAVSSGAVCLVVSADFPEERIPHGVGYARVSDSYYAWAALCEAYFGNPAESFDIHAVTGTNGKTSIAFMLKHFFDAANGGRTALQTTVETDVLSGTRCESQNTTPDAYTLQGLFAEMRSNSAAALAMEYSSHGLSQHRAGNTRFSSAIFTNLTGDHLDYHKDMETYYAVKRTLFTDMMKKDAPRVINIDDAYGARLFAELSAKADSKSLAVSRRDEKAFCFIRSITLHEGRTEFDVRLDGHELSLSSRLTGEHNVYNLASALTAAYACRVALETLVSVSATVPAAPGRLEEVILASKAHAFVDYAHTDDALYNVLRALNALRPSGGRIITLFGCGGDRDKTKRPRMGRVASEFSDIAIVTSDNPRSESPSAIIADILNGVSHTERVKVIEDRAEAIREACMLSRRGDLVLIAGKGHENYQIIGSEKHCFSDIAELRKYI